MSLRAPSRGLSWATARRANRRKMPLRRSGIGRFDLASGRSGSLALPIPRVLENPR